MPELPPLTRVPYAIATCSFKGCPKPANYFSQSLVNGRRLKLCRDHVSYFAAGEKAAEREQRANHTFEIGSMGLYDDTDGSLLPPGDADTLANKKPSGGT